jgi:hypothetical protein
MESNSETSSVEDILELTRGLEESPPKKQDFKVNPNILRKTEVI